MYSIIAALHDSNCFSSVQVIEFIDEESVKLLKIRATLTDKSLLYIMELATYDYQKYSYHWQKENGELIIRWDNKPHWKNISTFPHHRHDGENVLPSVRVSIEDVIKEINMRLEQIK
ncbi:MAG TPA: hypothetical protein DCQ37_17140 [Desulfobacteraceae bacterium]|nr:hypothetical protein [Desulfobacteraceae bacterium]